MHFLHKLVPLAVISLPMMACDSAVPQGQFGPYQPPFKHLVLPDGLQLVVYRVKFWTFSSGQSPALQLEYEFPYSVSDKAQVRQLARRIWPTFASYLEGMHLQVGIVTASNLRRNSWLLFSTSNVRSFGLVAVRDSVGVWRFQGDTLPLPPAAAKLGIIDTDDKPMPILNLAPNGAPPNTRLKLTAPLSLR